MFFQKVNAIDYNRKVYKQNRQNVLRIRFDAKHLSGLMYSWIAVLQPSFCRVETLGKGIKTVGGGVITFGLEVIMKEW